MITGIARLGSDAHSPLGGDDSWMTSTPASLSAATVPRSRAPRALVLERADHDRLVAGLELAELERLGAERAALLLLLGADIAAAERRHHLRHRHVLVHHLDAVLVRLFGQRHDRGVARMAHHGDAAGLDRDRFAQLLHHLLDVPLGEDVVDLRPEIGRRLLGAIVDDGAEGVALGAADEEADVDVLAPLGVERLRRQGGDCGAERRGGGHDGRAQNCRSHRDAHALSSLCPRKPRGFDIRFGLRRNPLPAGSSRRPLLTPDSAGSWRLPGIASDIRARAPAR